jgi:hypothetical protein
MTGLPAHCSHCGLFFISNLFQVENSTDITFKDIGVSCPRCGKMANGIDGTFDFVENAIRVKQAPPKTLEILKALQDAVASAMAGADENTIVEELQRKSPEFAELASLTLQKSGLVSLIFLLVYLLTSCSANIDQTLDWNKLVDQAHVYITGSDPYPLGETRTQGQATDEHPQHMSKQQRRQQERQSKKLQKHSGKQHQSKSCPKKP